MCEASSVPGFPDLVHLNISLTNLFIFFGSFCEHRDTEEMFFKPEQIMIHFPQHMGLEDIYTIDWLYYLHFQHWALNSPNKMFQGKVHGCILIFFQTFPNNWCLPWDIILCSNILISLICTTR